MDESQLLLSVTGMTCSACVASVERVLSNVDGVVSVSVNLPLEKATVSLSEATVDAVAGQGPERSPRTLLPPPPRCRLLDVRRPLHRSS